MEDPKRGIVLCFISRDTNLKFCFIHLNILIVRTGHACAVLIKEGDAHHRPLGCKNKILTKGKLAANMKSACLSTKIGVKSINMPTSCISPTSNKGIQGVVLSLKGHKVGRHCLLQLCEVDKHSDYAYWPSFQ